MENNEEKLKNKIVETYTSDMVKALENDKSGLIKKIINEEEKHEEQNKSLLIKTKRNRLFLFLSVIFIFLAFIILIFIIFLNENINTAIVTPQYSSIIFIDQSNFLAVDGFNKEKIAKAVFNQINNTKVKAGGIEGIYLTVNKNIIGLKEFTKLIKSNLVLDKTDFINDNFLLGVVNITTSNVISSNIVDSSKKQNKNGFFILLKVRSLADTFTAMHNWEIKMLDDLSLFLGVEINSLTNYLFTKNFEDAIVENKNARILYDDKGQIILMYVFINDSSIIITNSELATKEVILRLTSSQINK